MRQKPEELLKELLNTKDGRKKLAESMVAPIRDRRFNKKLCSVCGEIYIYAEIHRDVKNDDLHEVWYTMNS